MRNLWNLWNLWNLSTPQINQKSLKSLFVTLPCFNLMLINFGGFSFIFHPQIYLCSKNVFMARRRPSLECGFTRFVYLLFVKVRRLARANSVQLRFSFCHFSASSQNLIWARTQVFTTIWHHVEYFTFDILLVHFTFLFVLPLNPMVISLTRVLKILLHGVSPLLFCQRAWYIHFVLDLFSRSIKNGKCP